MDKRFESHAIEDARQREVDLVTWTHGDDLSFVAEGSDVVPQVDPLEGVAGFFESLEGVDMTTDLEHQIKQCRLPRCVAFEWQQQPASCPGRSPVARARRLTSTVAASEPSTLVASTYMPIPFGAMSNQE